MKMKMKKKNKKIYTSKQLIKKRKTLWEKNHSPEKDYEFTEKITDLITKDNKQGKILRNSIQRYPEDLIELVFTIIDKDKNTVPFFLNYAQRELVDLFNKQIDLYEKGEANFKRFVILKSRQLGCTSLISAYQLVKTITQQNFEGITIAHTGKDTSKIFSKKAKRPFSNLPKKLKPTEKANNRRELNFGKINSVWSIMTAGATETGRGGTINFAHLSEVAFFPHMDKILAGMAQALTKSAFVVLESTANGYNKFKDLWDEAYEGNSQYTPIFLYWWDDPGYVLNFESEDIKNKFIKDLKTSKDSFYMKLRKLKKEENLSLEQLYWYYNKKKELKGDLLQEYPCYPSEAFLSSGRPYFSLKKLDTMIIDRKHEIPISKESGGDVLIYEKAKKGRKYVIGADVAEGLKGGDYSSAAIYDTTTMKQVARVHGHFDPNVYGRILVKYAVRYNEAYLGIENNNHGHSVLNTVYNTLDYTNIHFTVNQALKHKKATKKKGWSTTSTSKYIMLDELDEAIRQDAIDIMDLEALEQLREVTKDEKGRANINGKDMVVAHCIAYQMRKFQKKTVVLW